MLVSLESEMPLLYPAYKIILKNIHMLCYELEVGISLSCMIKWTSEKQ